MDLEKLEGLASSNSVGGFVTTANNDISLTNERAKLLRKAVYYPQHPRLRDGLFLGTGVT